MDEIRDVMERRCPVCGTLVLTLVRQDGGMSWWWNATYHGHMIRDRYVCDDCAGMGASDG